MNRQSLKQKSKASVLIALAVLVGATILMSPLSIRLDLTQGNQYSLSKTSKSLMKDLDKQVEVKVYFSKELPNYLLSTKQFVSDLLNEYQRYGGSKLKIEYIDPTTDQALEQKVQQLGIPKLQFNVVEDDKYQVTNGFLGIAVNQVTDEQETVSAKTEILPVVENLQNFEYDLTLAIKKITQETDLGVGFATGFGGKGKTELTVLTKLLGKQYLVTDFDVSSGALVPDYINTLIIAGPQETYSDRSIYVVDQFVMRGGSLLVLDDKILIDQNLQPYELENNLDGLLAHYGFTVNKDLVDDVSNEMANFSQGYMQFFVQYPLWLKIQPKNFDKDNVMVSQLEGLTLPWVSSVDYYGPTELDGSQEDKEVSYLVKSTDKAWLQTADFNLDPQNQQATFNLGTQGTKNLAISAFGPFKSYFINKEIPKPAVNSNLAETILEKSDWSRIIVMGDTDFIADGFLQSFNSNPVFIQNIVDGLTQDADLIQIRSKSITDRSLKELSSSTRNTLKYAITLGPTLLIILYGLYRFWNRKKKNFVDYL